MKKERVKTGEMGDTETMSGAWFCAIVLGRHLWETLGYGHREPLCTIFATLGECAGADDKGFLSRDP